MIRNTRSHFDYICIKCYSVDKLFYSLQEKQTIYYIVNDNVYYYFCNKFLSESTVENTILIMQKNTRKISNNVYRQSIVSSFSIFVLKFSGIERVSSKKNLL